MSDNHARLSPALVETIAGLSAGTFSTLAVHPLDVIKTRLQSKLSQPTQVPGKHLTFLVQRNTSKTPTNALAIFRSLTLNEHPIQSLYRGLTPNLIGNASSWALFFYFKSLVETQLVAFHTRPSQPLSDSGHNVPASLKSVLTPLDYFLASGISGTLITLSTNPIWVLKTRMLSSDKGAEGAYKNMWHGAGQIMNREGVKGFYKGLGVSLLGNSHGAVQFAVYEPMKNLWTTYLAQESSNRKDEKLGNTATLIISSSAKIFAGTVTYPYQVIRSRIQTYHGEKLYGRGISGVVVKIWNGEGFRGFYRGLGTNVLRVLPATWATFLVYENVRYYLPRWSRMGREEIPVGK
ncbi:mitochondrial carrier protein [Marssonina coronariae]|uniref:Mitochondrial carrier protein n=1 Tax=Diplocarpon coronariae TaxID=2795749 RepID=A0A218YWK8_9HELO|nr:mitochondrial carrier protein [Marssonina coronariae]